MKTHPIINQIIAFSAAISMSGCASVMSGTYKNVSIESNPPGAHVSVADKKGREVASLNTPCIANLKRGAFYIPASYVATIDKPGYETVQVKINPTVNPWIIGNVLIGGLVGLIIIDPLTGAMFDLTPSKINAQLAPAVKH